VNPAALRVLVGGVIAIAAPASLACSSCGCTLSSDWDSQGLASSLGLRLDLRLDALDQSQLRSGTGSVNRDAIALPVAREIELDTRNRYASVVLDYHPARDWGINIQLPLIMRSHASVAEGDTEASNSRTSALGDVRVIGRYQGFTAARYFGVQLGLKLPTGATGQRFGSGPQAGEALDRGLQAGSGSTDLLLGLYRFGTLDQHWDYFSQAMLALPLTTRGDYRPGAALNANAGLRYMASDTVIPQLQLNAKTGRRDSGAEADADNSGGTLLYLSPGLTIVLSKKASVYGFVQVPLYQRVNGYQLAPRYTVSFGVGWAL
jgi:hypothetical protein